MAAARVTDGAVQGVKVGRLRCKGPRQALKCRAGSTAKREAQVSAEVPSWDDREAWDQSKC